MVCKPGPEGKRDCGPAEQPLFDCKVAHIPLNLSEEGVGLGPTFPIRTKENGRVDSRDSTPHRSGQAVCPPPEEGI